jgi:TPP-dependent 2-oxoacid decarboxylase
MNHPLYMGVYAGAVSPTRIRKRVEQADLIISLGAFLTDIELGGSQPPEALRHRSIWAVENRVNVSFHTYTDVTARFCPRLDTRGCLSAIGKSHSDNPAKPRTDLHQRVRG